MQQESYPVKLFLRIDWADLDLFGHVNNVTFLKYVQAARVQYWEQIGLYQEFLDANLGPMVVSVSCQYKKPLFYPGNVVVESRMKFIKNTSFCLQHRISDEHGAIAAEAEDIIVMYDFNRNEKIRFPDKYREASEKLERRTIPSV